MFRKTTAFLLIVSVPPNYQNGLRFTGAVGNFPEQLQTGVCLKESCH